MKKNVYYTIKELADYEFSEIDFDLYREIFPEIDEKSDDYYEGDGWYQSIGSWGSCDGYPIAIDRMIEKLNEFKQLGANYVSLDYHCDHIGYVIAAIKINQSTPEEIEEVEGKERKKRQAKEEYDKKMREITEEYNNKILDVTKVTGPKNDDYHA